MSATQPLTATPVPTSIDNQADWDTLAAQIVTATGLPAVVTPEMIAGMVGSAVPLLFAADAARNLNLLRGTFSDPVVAQRLQNAGELNGEQPTSVVIHLVGARTADGHPVVRVHLDIQTEDAGGHPATRRQFWDLECGARVTVGQPVCPNCGAPVGQGELICGHCHTDVRSMVEVPLVVSRLELY